MNLLSRRQTLRTLITTAIACPCARHRASGQEPLEAEWRCSYDGSPFEDQIYTYASNREAAAVVTKILRHTGLKQNFEIRAANVPNAMATIQGERRLILYNQEFMMNIRKATRTDWSGTSILAHEIGHHLQGHTIKAGGSRPVLELEADHYSGFVLQRMGATLDEAKAAMNSFGSAEGSSTHPRKRDRLVSIVAGWNQAKELVEVDKDRIPEPPDSDPVPQPSLPETPPDKSDSPSTSPPPGGPAGAHPVARCVFQGDPHAYLVMSDNAIISFNQLNQAVIIGRRIPPTVQDFAWMYQNSFATFGVDSAGRIWGTNAFGQPAEVGYVTNP